MTGLVCMKRLNKCANLIYMKNSQFILVFKINVRCLLTCF